MPGNISHSLPKGGCISGTNAAPSKELPGGGDFARVMTDTYGRGKGSADDPALHSSGAPEHSNEEAEAYPNTPIDQGKENAVLAPKQAELPADHAAKRAGSEAGAAMRRAGPSHALAQSGSDSPGLPGTESSLPGFSQGDATLGDDSLAKGRDAALWAEPAGHARSRRRGAADELQILSPRAAGSAGEDQTQAGRLAMFEKRGMANGSDAQGLTSQTPVPGLSARQGAEGALPSEMRWPTSMGGLAPWASAKTGRSAKGASTHMIAPGGTSNPAMHPMNARDKTAAVALHDGNGGPAIMRDGLGHSSEATTRQWYGGSMSARAAPANGAPSEGAQAPVPTESVQSLPAKSHAWADHTNPGADRRDHASRERGSGAQGDLMTDAGFTATNRTAPMAWSAWTGSPARAATNGSPHPGNLLPFSETAETSVIGGDRQGEYAALMHSDGRPIAGGSPFSPAVAGTNHHAAAMIRQLIEVSGQLRDGPVEVALNPEELGRVRMQITSTEQGVVMHITAERSETLDMLRRHIDQLQRDLSAMGYDNPRFSFDRDGGQNQPHPQDDRKPDHPNPPDTSDQKPLSVVPSQVDGLDIRI